MQKKIEALRYRLKAPFLDIGRPDDSILLTGMGRSGTTWAANIINHDRQHRVLFEPFFPSLVKEATRFKYIQYMNPDDSSPGKTRDALKILNGRVRSQWVDKENSGLLYHSRIIKDIRTNLMAAWLKSIAPQLPVILMIRHPLQVAESWRTLGWGTQALGEKTDLEIIMSQKPLLDDYPELTEIQKKIDPDNYLDMVVFLWGVYHYVPLRQFQRQNFFLLFYEQLLLEPEQTCKKLFTFINKPFTWTRVQQAFARESSTNFQNRDMRDDRERLLDGWKSHWTGQEIERATDLLKMFDLHTLYSKEGLPDLMAS